MVPIRYNVRNLFVRRATTLAAALGVALVVFVLAAALMLAEGLARTLDMSGRRDTAIVLRKGSDSEMPSSIEDATVTLIKGAPGVKKGDDGAPMVLPEAVVVLFQDLSNGKGKSNVTLRGVPLSEVQQFRPEVKVVQGKLAAAGSDEVIVGTKLVGRFKGLEVGQSLELRKNRAVKVVGVFESDGSSFESEVWGDLDYVRQSFGREGVVSSVRVRLDSPAVFDGFAAALEQDKRLGLDASPEPEFYKKQSENTSIFIMALGTIIAVFFSIGAMIGGMITMYGAVAHRRREIGVLRALGFSRSAIMFSFLLESVLLALLGGAIGTVASLAMGMVKFSMLNFTTFSEIVFEFHATPEILVRSLIFGGVMGIIGGFLPAIRAARTAPIEAMKG
ncbi:MAG: ABC transporter permease [Deltaproteobacteria bacterium]|nr:ABC transporter permease [Deltaproteobacteria bacterium]MBK8714653.1 ABC transporter permease [Deltaproteobacteria bacterium]MBP7291843.1 ABC transporter permease [Nannocystaceae bacterium]